MRRFLGLALAAGLWLGHAPAANAQFGVVVNTPFQSTVVGSPYGIYGSGMYPYNPYIGLSSTSLYSSSYVAPNTTFYSSGYRGFGPGYSVYSAPGAFYSSRYPVYGATYAYPVYGRRGLMGRWRGW